MARFSWLLAMLLSFAPILSAAATQTYVGPLKLKANTKKAIVHDSTFVATPQNTGILLITNGSGQDLSPKPCTGGFFQKLACTAENVIRLVIAKIERPSYVEVSLNGRVVVSNSLLKQTMGSLQIPVSLLSNNRLQIRLGVIPTQHLSVSIKGNSTQPNQSPLANFTATPPIGVAPQAVTFNALMSSDPDGQIQDYFWDFGDGQSGTGSLITHTYLNAGTYVAKLTVTDNQGAQTQKSTSIQVQANQIPTANFTVTLDQDPLSISVDGTNSSDTDGQIISWFYDFGDGSSASTSVANHTYPSSGTYSINLTVTDNKGATHSISKSLTVTAKLPPIAKLKATSPTTGIAPLVVIIDGSESSSPHGATLTYDFDFGDGHTEVSSSGQITHIYQQAGNYTVTLRVKDDEDRTAEKQIAIIALDPTLPPNPAESAPPIPESQGQTLASSVSFLYEGPDASQKNVQPGSLDSNRIAVLRGRVLNDQGEPLSGVDVSVLEMPQVGSTLTHDDGLFNLVINGGGSVTIRYQRNGYFPVQRKVSTSFLDYFWAEEVVMVAPNPIVSRIPMNNQSMQVTQPVTVSDSSGQRSSTLMIPANTVATVELPNGTTRTLPTMSIRMTEYTVGNQGPKRMPAALPATTSYTYAVDLSADEALALGSDRVTFSKPLPYYVDNFLNFPIGTAVPTGSYNYRTGAWEAEEDGVVVKVLDIQNNQAILDIKGQGQSASQAELNDLEISSEELSIIAQRFQVGKTLWRAQITHFSPWDLNWLTTVGGTLSFSGVVTTNSVQNCVCSPKSEGSIIDINSQSLGEVLPITGTPFTLNYNSTYAPGRKSERKIVIPISDVGVQMNTFTNIRVQIEVAGKIHEENLPTSTQYMTWTWDGKDAYGRDIPWSVPARVQVHYESPTIYRIFQRQSGMRSFTLSIGNSILSSVPGRDVARITRTNTLPISMDTFRGSRDVGGWTIDKVHKYNPIARRVYFGNGTTLDTANMVPLVVSVAGSRLAPGNTGDGGYATQAQLGSISSIAQAPDGSIFIADQGNGRIRKITNDGKIQHTINQSGVISGMVVDTEGSLYFANTTANRVYKLTSDGTLDVIAGTGTSGFSGDDGPAVSARLAAPSGLVRDNDGTIYVGDQANGRIRKISPSGIITTFAGTGNQGGNPTVDGASAVTVNIGTPTSLAIGPNHDLYFTTSLYNQSDRGSYLRVIRNDGTIRTLAGTPNNGYTGDNGPAASASLNQPRGIDVSNDGTIFFLDRGNFVIRSISPDGVIQTVAGGYFRNSNAAPLPSVANETTFTLPQDLKIFDGNSLLIADATFVRMYRRSLPAFSPAGYTIPSIDSSEIYQFAADGTHLRTLFSRTGAIKYSFTYSPEGKIIAIQDADQNTTTIERDSAGNPISISGPFGSQSIISTTSDGYLKSVTNPNGEKYQMGYSNGGLLSYFTKPSGASSTFDFNAIGELVKDTDAAGGFKSLARVDSGKSYEVTQTTAQGRKTTVKVTVSSDTRMQTTHPDTSRVDETVSTAQTRSLSGPWSTQESVVTSVDPRLGGPAQFTRVRNYHNGNQGYTITASTNYTPLSATDAFKFSQTYLITEGPKITNVSYDSASRTNYVQTGLGRNSTVKTDTKERATEVTIGSLLPINYSYNSKGQLASIQQGDRLNQFTYDSRGNLKTLTNALNQTITYSHDQVGRVLASSDSIGNGPTLTYDENGNLKTLTPPDGIVHSFISNLVDLFSVYTPPSTGNSGSTSYLYSLDRELTKETRATGKEIIYTYHPTLGNVTKAQGQTKTYDFGYTNQSMFPNRYNSSDGIILNTTLVNQGYRTRIYSGALAGQINYSYGLTVPGQLPSFTIGTTVVSYGYDNDSLLTNINGLAISRDTANGFVQSEIFGSISTAHQYNSYGERTRLTTAFGGSTVYDVQYTWDALGRVSSKTESILGELKTAAYTYDSRGRLIASVGTDNHQYSYDGNGNRLTADGTTLQYDAQDRLLQAGDKQYAYTADGTLLVKQDVGGGNKVTYTYDDFGQLTKVEPAGGNVIEYLTGGENQRLVKKVNGIVTQKFMYHNSLQIAAELLPSNSVKSIFIYGLQSHSPDLMMQGSTTYRFIKDQLGSIRLVMNLATGEVAQRIDYDDFGKVLLDTNPGFQPFGFAGGLYDADTGLVRFGARDYDPSIGRWTTKDPIGFGGGSANLYGYVNNDPVNLIDPTGLWSISLSGYAGWGGGIVIGQNPDGSAFVTLQGGVGVGGGASWDPNGRSDDNVCSGVSIGQYASAGANIGPLEGNYGVSSGFAQTGGSYYNPPGISAGVTPSIGIKAGVSGGIQGTWHW